MAFRDDVRRLRRSDPRQRRERLKKLLDRLNRSFGNLRNIAKMSPVIKKQVEDRINKEGFPQKLVQFRFDKEARSATGAGRWKQLSPSTIKRRGSAHPILQDTGALLSGALRAAKGKFTLTKGINLDVDEIGGGAGAYAGYVQAGTSKMVARPFFNDATDQELEAIGAKKRAREIAIEIIRDMIRKAVA